MASLQGAPVRGAGLEGERLQEAELRGTHGLIPKQVEATVIDENRQMLESFPKQGRAMG